jgi:hypothetical protein
MFAVSKKIVDQDRFLLSDVLEDVLNKLALHGGEAETCLEMAKASVIMPEDAVLANASLRAAIDLFRCSVSRSVASA